MSPPVLHGSGVFSHSPDHVYYRELVLLQEIAVDEKFEPGDEFAIAGEVSWLACKGLCVPGDVEFLVNEVYGAKSDFESAQVNLPAPWDEEVLQSRWKGATLQVAGPYGAKLTFVPDNDCGKLVNLIADGEGTVLNLRFRTEAGTVGPVRGLITIEMTGAPRRSFRADIPAVSLPPKSSGG